MDPNELLAAIQAAKHGRQDGFQAVLAAYGPRLFGYFYRAAGNRHEAEDLLGEMMLRLVRTLPEYDERGRFEPWLFRIAANLVRDRIRRRKAAPAGVSLSAESPDGSSMDNVLPAAAQSVDGNLMASEANEQLMAALDTLDDTTRQMILLRHFADMSFARIAELMQCPIGTALAKVHRGLKALRGKLRAPPAADSIHGGIMNFSNKQYEAVARHMDGSRERLSEAERNLADALRPTNPGWPAGWTCPCRRGSSRGSPRGWPRNSPGSRGAPGASTRPAWAPRPRRRRRPS